MNAKQLKDSILLYAIQGKLLPQDPNDEPAIEILKRSAKEKAQLIKDRHIKKEKPLPTITEDEIPFDIPTSWEWVRIKDISYFGNFETVTPKYIQNTDWILDLEEIEKESGKLLYKAYNNEKRVKSNKYKFKKNDVLYGKLRPYLNKVIIADEDGLCTTEIFPIRTLENICPKYVKYVLMSPYFINYANGCSYGVKMPRLGTNHMALALVPLPPLIEQQKIVEKIEELLPLIDKYGHLHAEQVNIKEIFPTNLQKSILQYAMQGKLVEQDANDVPAQQLIEKLLLEKERLIKEKIIKKEKPLPPITEEEIPFDFPITWGVVRLGDVVQFQGGSQPEKSVFIDEHREGYIRLVQIRDFKSDKFMTYIPIDKAKRFFNEDDIMIGRYGPPVFQILRGLSGAYNVALMKAIPNEQLINKDFLYYLLQSPYIQNIVIEDSSRTAGQSGVRKELIDSIIVGIPPLNEQKRIVQAIEKMLLVNNKLIQ